MQNSSEACHYRTTSSDIGSGVQNSDISSYMKVVTQVATKVVTSEMSLPSSTKKLASIASL